MACIPQIAEKQRIMTEIFSQKTQEELKSYVYILIDPRDNKIFYVGKGYGNRVFFILMKRYLIQMKLKN